MTVRAAKAADSGGVAAIWNHYIRHTTVTFAATPKTPAEVADLIATRPAFFVAEVAGGILGFATYAQFRGGDGYARCMEHTVQLAPDASGGGLGGICLDAVWFPPWCSGGDSACLKCARQGLCRPDAKLFLFVVQHLDLNQARRQRHPTRAANVQLQS